MFCHFSSYMVSFLNGYTNTPKDVAVTPHIKQYTLLSIQYPPINVQWNFHPSSETKSNEI